MDVQNDTYNEMIQSAAKLVKKIQEKHRSKKGTITQEEADFANAFLDFTSEILQTIEKK